MTSFAQEVPTTDADDWQFIKEDKGVKLYNRTIEGFEFKEVKAILDINVDLGNAKTFLENPNNIVKWMSGCRISVSKKRFETHSEYYAIFDAPWPVSDRDDYGKIVLEEDTEKTLHLSFKSMPDGTPEVSKMIRVPYSKGHIKIEELPSGYKILTYQMLVDRGGSLPSYLKDYLENSSPVNTIQKLKSVLEDQKS